MVDNDLDQNDSHSAPFNAQEAERDRRKSLSPAAQRALAEAEARRAEAEVADQDRPTELGGTKGPEPTRYGDWEKNGRCSDF